jgi:hypothetical protein
MDYTKELSAILETDPLGLLDVKPKSSGVLTADARLVASFQEINDYVRNHGHEPTESRDIQERRLYSRLKGIRDNPSKTEALIPYDEFNLLATSKLADIKSINSVDDILGSDALGLLDDEVAEAEEAESIFTLTHVKAAPKMPDYIAKRKPCKEFDQLEPLFKSLHADLATRKKVTKPFNSEKQIAPGEFFILQGMIVYVANKGNWEKKNFGNYNARLYCVFENGTESNLFLRSLAAAFWKDPNSRQIVDGNQYELFQQKPLIVAEDAPTGYIYVLKSLSKDPQIAQMQDLYKIGFSSNKVEQRTQGAKDDPTYLFNNVRPIAEFQTFNLNPQKLELLIHRFFAEACLNVDVYGADGKRFSPREWFVAPLHVICQAIEYVISEEITQFVYDPNLKEIVRREKVD